MSQTDSASPINTIIIKIILHNYLWMKIPHTFKKKNNYYEENLLIITDDDAFDW